MRFRRWLVPGMGIKRWLGLVFAGLLLLALAGAQFLRQVTRDLEPGGLGQSVVDLITLQFLPFALRGMIIAVVGIAMVAIGAYRVLLAVTNPLRAAEDQPLVEVIYQKRFLARGPRIVAIGGGTGLSTLLRGMKEHTSNLTAIVTVADDGGSSGTLRDELGIPAVGDIRNCIAALADAEPLMRELLGYRFPGGHQPVGEPGPIETEPGGLGGHAVGNLLLAALTSVEGGDFEQAVRTMNRVLAVRGRVVPASPTPITLHARTRNGVIVSGQSSIGKEPEVERVWITPHDVAASNDAVLAIADAEIIVVGPGSLYTSVLPVLLIPEIRDAVAAASAIRIYVCNVATQVGETTGYDLADHIEALVGHTSPGIIDLALANDRFDAQTPADWHAEAVKLRWPPAVDPVPRLATDDVVDPGNAHHHESARLAAAVLRAAELETSARRPRRGPRSGQARSA